MSLKTSYFLRLFAAAFVFIRSFLKYAELHLLYGTDQIFSILYFVCNILFSAAIILLFDYFGRWTKNECIYIYRNLKHRNVGIISNNTIYQPILLPAPEFPVNFIGTHEINKGTYICDIESNNISQDTQLTHIQYTKNDITINQNLTINNIDTPGNTAVGSTEKAPGSSFSKPATDSQIINNGDDIIESNAKDKNSNNPQGNIKVIKPYVPYRRKNKIIEDIETLYNLVDHYIGGYLDENDKATLKYDIIQFATEEKPIITPILHSTNIPNHIYDILRLIHGVGYHIGIRRNGPEIAEFAIKCFDEKFKGKDPVNMSKKFTYTYYDANVPKFDKKEPLPKDSYPEQQQHQ